MFSSNLSAEFVLMIGALGGLFGLLGLIISLLAVAQSRKRFGTQDSKSMKVKLQELNIRLDDMAAKVANSHALIVKETGQVVEKIKVLDEIIASRPAEVHPINLEFDSGNNLDDRVLRLEEIVAGLPEVTFSAGNGQLTLSADDELELTLDDDSSEFRLATMDDILRTSRNRFCGELRSIVENREESGSQFIPKLEKLLQTHHFSRASMVFKTILSDEDKLQKLTPDRAQMIVRKSAAELLMQRTSASFFESIASQRPAVVVVAGADEADKLVVTAGLVKHFTDRKKKVLVGACDVQQVSSCSALVEWCKSQQIEVVTPLDGDRAKRLAYKSVHRAQDEDFDILIIDAVGSLYQQRSQITELRGILQMLEREQPTGSQQVLLNLDAAKNESVLEFLSEISATLVPSGVCFSRLSEAERGSILLAVVEAVCPVCFVATSEHYQSLRVFSEEEYLDALFAVDLEPFFQSDKSGILEESNSASKKKREIASIL